MIRLDLKKVSELSAARRIHSQAELARISGWTPRHLNRVIRETEKGGAPSFSIKMLNGLCTALRCPPNSLLVYEAEPDPFEVAA